MKKILFAACMAITMIACKDKNTTQTSDNTEIEQTMNAEKHYFSDETNREILTTLEGNQLSFEEIINQQKGKLTVVEIWASWCPDCIKGFPKLEELQENFPDLNFVFVSLDKTPEDWKAAIEKYNLKGNHFYIQQKMKESFGTSVALDWIPRYILVNKDGSIINFKAITADEEAFINDIKAHYNN
ncbi:TlpA family protein disulfide reductase [Capnocytophaga sp. ARDL2]|uniref:TlpA family protein disulfide reductase n=1 Tax=Capnocytophaga sp. ARDL2 TaxID=3238809 RepID=UPI0035589C90